MKKHLSYFILLFGLLNSFLLRAQTISPLLDATGQKVTTSLSDYSKRYPQEKIFVHTDQNVYLSGQTIWFKAYTMAYGKPSTLSKIIYVALTDAQGKLIRQYKLPLKTGKGYGNINLSDSLQTGWYQLQAFTAWMLNFGKEDLYHRKIYIQNVHDKADQSLAVTGTKTYHIDFFPEGGDLVDGHVCNVAFRATDESGLPANIYGDVLDKNKRSIANLVTVHDGMGSFEVEASESVNYTAQVHLPDNSVQSVALPRAKKADLSMRVNAAPANQLEVKMTYTGQQQYKNIIIEAVQNNGVIAGYPVKLSRGTNVFRLKKDDFLTGIVRLTIFDESGIPGAERIVFINNNDLLKFSLAKDTLSLSSRSRNALTLNLKNNKGMPVKGNLSVAVTDAVMGTEPGDNICSYFLMSSELRGQVHQPGYYFKNNSDALQQQLDLVMMTNGWRHFKWDTVFKPKPQLLKYFVENAQMIAGQIENYHDKDNFKIKLMITGADSSKIIKYIEPDSSGCFALKDYDKRGTASMYFEVVNAKNRKQPAKIVFFKQDVDTIRFAADTSNNLAEGKPIINSTYLDSELIDQSARFVTRGIMLKTVNIKQRKTTPTDLVIKSHVHRLDLDNASTFDLINTPTLQGISVIKYIQGRIPGLQVYLSPDGQSYIFKYRGSDDLTNHEPFFYVDEAQVTLADVESIPLSDIALIRYAPPPAWFAPMGGGFIGAILVYTKNSAEDKGTGSRKVFDHYTFNGYSITREFPSADDSIAKQNMQPDYRTTLYWNHDLNTDAQGNIKLHFYNSDKAKKYRVIVQGMDADGRVGYLSEEF